MSDYSTEHAHNNLEYDSDDDLDYDPDYNPNAEGSYDSANETIDTDNERKLIKSDTESHEVQCVTNCEKTNSAVCESDRNIDIKAEPLPIEIDVETRNDVQSDSDSDNSNSAVYESENSVDIDTINGPLRIEIDEGQSESVPIDIDIKDVKVETEAQDEVLSVFDSDNTIDNPIRIVVDEDRNVCDSGVYENDSKIDIDIKHEPLRINNLESAQQTQTHDQYHADTPSHTLIKHTQEHCQASRYECHQRVLHTNNVATHKTFEGDSHSHSAVYQNGSGIGLNIQNNPQRTKEVNPETHTYNQNQSFIPFHTPITYNQHNAAVRQHECTVCHKQFSDANACAVCTHVEEENNECGICHTRVTYKRNLARHMRSHKTHEGDICHKRFTGGTYQNGSGIGENNPQRNQIHDKNLTSPPLHALITYAQQYCDGGEHQCTVCHKRFSSQSARIEHMLTHARDTNECCICHKQVAHRKNLARHMLAHTAEKTTKPHDGQIVRTVQVTRTYNEEKKYKCSLCNERFAHRANLLQHLYYHIAERKHECNRQAINMS